MTRLALAIQQIILVRKYSLNLIESIEPADWFRQPQPGINHVAWQVGHLAVAQYWLTMNRVRGQRPEDAALLSEAFLQRYGRLSQPDPNPAQNPTPAELRATLDRVHAAALRELEQVPDSELDQPVGKPHPMFSTKLGAILWSAQHEMLHAGQIGLLRRLFGKEALW